MQIWLHRAEVLLLVLRLCVHSGECFTGCGTPGLRNTECSVPTQLKSFLANNYLQCSAHPDGALVYYGNTAVPIV